MRDVLLVSALIAILATGPVLIGFGLWRTFTRKPVEEKYRGSGGGLVGVFDAVWSPSAHEAGMERDRQAASTAPAPSPGDPPWQIEGGRIRIDRG
ncbi:MAG: hypothetical protein QM611_03335 [Microbacterium sp.]|uniref:hypothetical protein n=1 Tax=Microbacterium sp. TaxID=51671 RepID=UPI0039E3DA15